MPELPEVEFARSCLSRWLVGHTIAAATAAPSRVLRPRSKRALASLVGLRVREVERRGKWLLVEFEGAPQGIVAHLGMTGKFELAAKGAPTPRWSRVQWLREDGATVHYRDPRMFGEVRVGLKDELQGALPPLGPDALGIDAEVLAARISGRARPIKDVLMDQKIVAGLGNIYATEALFRARIHPSRKASTLRAPEIRALARRIDESLRRMFAMQSGESITYVEERKAPNPFLVYGRAGAPCPRCRTVLAKKVIGGRTSTFCPTCQPARGSRKAAITTRASR